MKDVIHLLFHLLTTLARLSRPGGSRTVIAWNLLLQQQLIIHSRSMQGAPNLSTQDRSLLRVWSLFPNPRLGCPRIAQQINLAFGLELDKDIVRRILANHYKPDPEHQWPSWLTTIGHSKYSLWSVDLFRYESILLNSHWVMVVMGQYTRRTIGVGVHAGNIDGQTSRLIAISLCGQQNIEDS